MQSRTKERRVFLFEQIVIFSELLRKGSLTPGYMFKRSIKVRVPWGCGEAGKNQVLKAASQTEGTEWGGPRAVVANQQYMCHCQLFVSLKDLEA